MIIVDTALRRRLDQGNPIRAVLIGPGYMGAAIVRQILNAVPGIRLVAVGSRTVDQAKKAYLDAGRASRAVTTARELSDCIRTGTFAVTDDPLLLCRDETVEVVIDTTGHIELGTQLALEAIKHGKHFVSMNAETDSTVGPMLKVYADRQGVVYTYTDGDEPGVAMNLFRLVDSMGYRPVCLGQIKGFLNRYRNPETQREFAEKHGQKAAMVASFADGSKLAIESAIIGNGTGFTPGKLGMFGHTCGHVKDLLNHFKPEDFVNGGMVDFVLGAEPHTGAFVIAHNDDPVNKEYMRYFKFGDGPLYVFYTPYHLPHLQLPHTVARAVLFQDPTLTPMGAPTCDAITYAKKDLNAGEMLDGMGGFTCYGMVDSYASARAIDGLPITLSVGCRLKRSVAKDQSIAYSDVELPVGRLVDRLRTEQSEYFRKGSSNSAISERAELAASAR